MPYSFVGLGATRVQNDLRVMGAFSGTATNIITTSNTPYSNGNALNTHAAGTAGTAVPGTTADYFCYQITTKTNAELYAQGGWGCSWKAMTWINNSVGSNITWDGTRYWMHTTSAVTGNWIGQSPDGKSWNFVQIVGSQPTFTSPSGGVALNGKFGFVDRDGAAAVVRYTDGNTFSSTVLAATGNPSARNGVASDTHVVFVGGNRIWVAQDLAGPWTQYTIGGGLLAVGNIPGTSIWIAGGGAGNVIRSEDNFATTPTLTTVGNASFNGVASSGTSTILSSTTSYRSTDNGITWDPVTFNIAGTYIISYGNGRYVGVSPNNTNIQVSTDDGVTWQNATSPFPTLGYYINLFNNGAVDGIRFQNGRFWLCVSGLTPNVTQNNYLLASSVDGFNWELHISVPPTAGAGSHAAGCQGIFAAQNTSGTPTNANTVVGFGLNTLPITQNVYPFWVMNNTTVGTGAPTQTLGVNQWHEYQIFGRPATTANEWAVTYMMDGIAYGPFNTTTFAAKAALPLWFNIHRGNFFTITSDIVFYDFPMADDPGLLGPDLRVYYDQPATDVSVEWTPIIEGAHNAEMVATTSITGATTYVFESDEPKTDQYAMQPTKVPAGFSILGTRNDAYFSRMQSIQAVANVGVAVDGVNADSMPMSVISPIGSWTYISQHVDSNPQSDTPWTRQKLNEAQLRIARAAPSENGDQYWPYVSLLAHFDEGPGALNTIDSSGLNTMSFSGPNAALVSTAKFGPSSIAINETGTTSAGIIIPRTESVIFRDQNFTIEAWVNPVVLHATGMVFFLTGVGSPQNSNNLWAVVRPSGVVELNLAAGSNLTFLTSSTSFPIVAGEWTHLAVVKLGTNYSVYVNGVNAGSATQSSNLVGVGDTMSIGSGSVSAARAWYGYIDEFRITKGVARYTADFTPPTGPFPDFY